MDGLEAFIAGGIFQGRINLFTRVEKNCTGARMVEKIEDKTLALPNTHLLWRGNNIRRKKIVEFDKEAAREYNAGAEAEGRGTYTQAEPKSSRDD